MGKFLTLLRLQMKGVFGINKLIHSKGKATEGKIALIILGIVGILALGGFISWALTVSFAALGPTTVLPAMALAYAAIMVFILTYLRASGVLFGHKDYDQTMSLPVSAGAIVLSRVAMIYITMVVVCAVVFVPSLVNYAVFAAAPQTANFVIFILAIFIAPLIPMTLSILAGTAIVAFTSRFRYANILVVVLAFVLLGGYLYVMFAWQAGLNAGLEQGLLAGEIYDAQGVGAAMADGIMNFYPPARWFVNAINEGSFAGFGIFSLVSVAAFGIYVFITARFYKAINTRLAAKRKRSNYQLGELKAGTAFSAMYKREMRRIPTSVTYAMNVAFGPLLLLVASVALVIIGPELIANTASFMFPTMSFGEVTAAVAPFLAFVPMFLGAMFPASCANLSLEGKNAWIMCSIPVPPKTIFASKMAMSLTFPLPTTIIFSIAAIFTMQPSAVDAALILLTPAAYVIFVTVLGMFVNAKLPKYDWDSEYRLLKGTGSAAVLLMVVVGLVFTAAIVITSFILSDHITIILAAVLTVCVIAILVILAALKNQKLFVD